MFSRRALVNNVHKLNNVCKLNKCNQIIRRFEHNNTDIKKLVDELDNIKRNIQGIHTDINIINRKVLLCEQLISILIGIVSGTGFSVLVLR